MRILSWNILHGGGQRTESIIDTIAEQQADIVLLQEFRHGKNGERICEDLRSLGLEQQFAPETRSARENSLLIASCFAFSGAVFPQPAVGISSDAKVSGKTHCVRAQFTALPSTEVGDLEIVSIHLPHKKLQIPYFESLLDLDIQNNNRAALLIGDFNCGIPFEDSQTQSFYATSWFQQLLRQGWTDSWRSRNPTAREFSWISSKHKNGYRYDHALSSSTLDKFIRDIAYEHAVRETGYSDHSLLRIDL